LKQVVIISGKGGTGKTTFAAVVYSVEGGVLADCDVDAPNLHILLQPKVLKREEVFVTKKAFIIRDKCTSCGLCYELCRFNAIKDVNGYEVDETHCEGCGFCYNACPEKAIEMRDVKTGDLFISKTDFGYFVHALLKPGEENSGRLVSEVKKKAKDIAEEKNAKFLLVDAAPGIGCPVIASLAGVDAAVVISEPTLSGLNDMVRVVRLAEHFRVKPFVVVNKYDLNEDMALKIEDYCNRNGIEFIGKIPFDEELIKQFSALKFPFDCPASEEVLECWDRVKNSIL